MAKSILSKKNTIVQNEINHGAFHLHRVLKPLCHYMVDVSQPETEARKGLISGYIKARPLMAKDSINRLYSTVRNYFIHCDLLGNNPLDETGYSSYFDRNGLLWKRVVQSREKQSLFMCEDGDDIGISEKSASALKDTIDEFLSTANIPVYIWSATFPKFNSPLNHTLPYSQHEQRVIIKRLSKTFDELAEYLLSNDVSQLPEDFRVCLNENVELRFPYRKLNTRINNQSPFNTFMSSAYILFAYYTSMNKSTIVDVRHPLKAGEKTVLDRTIKHITFTAFKARSNKQVEALVSNYSSLDNIPIAMDDKAGAISIALNKRTGFDFIKKLEQVSLLYNPSKESYKPLFYLLNDKMELKPFKSLGSTSLAERLCLVSDSREKFAPYICDLYFLAVNKNIKVVIKRNLGVNSTKVSKRYREIPRNQVNTYRTYLVKLFFLCFTEESINNVILPFEYIESDLSVTMKLRLKLASGKQIQIAIPSIHKPFLKLLEDFSVNIATLQYAGTLYPNVKNPESIFLLPNSTQSRFSLSGEGTQSNISTTKLKQLGFASDDFFVQLAPKKFRATTSIETYDSKDGGYIEQIITGHSKQVQDISYANGNPRTNHKILSEGINIIENLSKGNNIDEAKEAVIIRNKLSVLSYDEFIETKKPSNINGIFCSDSKPSGEALIAHRASLKYSDKLDVADDTSIKCYQYDLCPLCKSAMPVEDVHSVYKLLSFIECLQELQALHPDNQNLTNRIKTFSDVLHGNIDATIIQEAETKLINEGRYPLLNSTSSVIQYL
tara:strand:- start:3971 stop:6310 length:2340 start_codon:yes stop_codon:yes gene_type:complete